MEHIENDLEEFNHHEDVLSRFRASKSTLMVSDVWKKQLTLDKQEERESEPIWNNLFAPVQRHSVDQDKMRRVSKIAQNLADESDFNFVKMHLLNDFSDHICKLGNPLNASSELPEKAIMDYEHVYRQSNSHDAAFAIVWTNDQKEVFQFRELNANPSKQHRGNDTPPTKVPIK